MRESQVNVVFIGRGALFEALSRSLPDDASLTAYSIRKIRINSENHEIIDSIKKANLVVYLGYHHTNLFVNLAVLYKILSNLAKFNFKGLFVFFNTQAALDSKCYKDVISVPKFFKFDIYRFTKRIQSRMLAVFESDILISEVYLPVVTGRGLKAKTRFQEIALHKDIYMPISGRNYLILLELSNFCSWFWKSSLRVLDNESSSLTRKVFVFDEVSSISQLINDSRKRQGLPFIELKECKFDYIFSNSFSKNLIIMVKRSPIGLLLSIIIGMLKKSRSSAAPAHSPLIHHARSRLNDGIFVPDDNLYTAYTTEILLDQLEFNVVNLEND